jgi:WhiB family transcriptional regulator, redox-sensing transcriptional regulator
VTVTDPVPADAEPPCTRHPDWFIPDGRTHAAPIQEAAKHICDDCPYRQQCQDWSLTRVVHGVWGGLTEAERKREQRARRIVPVRLNISDGLPRHHTVEPRPGRWQQCGEGWGPIRRHETKREPMCESCRGFVNDYRDRKRQQRPDAFALVPCDLCGKELRPQSMSRHRRDLHRGVA